MKVIKKQWLEYLHGLGKEHKKPDFLFANPPWVSKKVRGPAGDWSDNTTGIMSLFSLCERSQVDLLFIWCPTELLDVPLTAARPIGYRYQTAIVWKMLDRDGEKDSTQADWFRDSTGFLLVFTLLFGKRKPLRSKLFNLLSYATGEYPEDRPRELELLVINQLEHKYGKLHGAYLFAGYNVAPFIEYDIDMVSLNTAPYNNVE